ncbi:ferritin [uncultured Gulosibacter sp.]|uniref:ferritin n=1 Tax=uncultured Gulosibacter sp. TaxID=1339167 RepID=UPI00288A0166|nr:ferritin [uncultured Gulosibacter sp.]
MEIQGKLASAVNTQVTLEQHSALAYDQLAYDMEALDLPGIASWFRAQADEERVHAAKFAQHLLDRGGRPQLEQIDAMTEHAETVLEAFEASLAQEKRVSDAIRNLYRIATAEGDIDSLPLLHWFIDEQLEEEASVSEIIGRVKLIGDDGAGLLKLDQELGSRPGGENLAEAE